MKFLIFFRKDTAKLLLEFGADSDQASANEEVCVMAEC